MNLKRLESRVMNDEGFRARPYLDTENVPTIGYGSTRLLGHPVQMDQGAITADAARLQLRADLWGAILDAQDLFPRFEEMNSVRQEVLSNMAYNLGRNRLSGFRKLQQAADQLDYEWMAEEMVDSHWFNQVGTRAKRLVAAMRLGDWA